MMNYKSKNLLKRVVRLKRSWYLLNTSSSLVSLVDWVWVYKVQVDVDGIIILK